MLPPSDRIDLLPSSINQNRFGAKKIFSCAKLKAIARDGSILTTGVELHDVEAVEFEAHKY